MTEFHKELLDKYINFVMDGMSTKLKEETLFEFLVNEYKDMSEEELYAMIQRDYGDEWFDENEDITSTSLKEFESDIEPDYKIEEYLDLYVMKVKFAIIGLGFCSGYATPVRYNTLESAKEAVRALIKYKNQVFHYVDEVENSND